MCLPRKKYTHFNTYIFEGMSYNNVGKIHKINYECFGLQITATVLATNSSEVTIVMGLAELFGAWKKWKACASQEPFLQHHCTVPAGSVTFLTTASSDYARPEAILRSLVNQWWILDHCPNLRSETYTSIFNTKSKKKTLNPFSKWHLAASFSVSNYIY